jgi:RNA-directed DNA polymerase
VSLFDIDSVAKLAGLLSVQPSELELASLNRGKLYRSYRIRKANGTFRTLHDPHGNLKTLQQKINRQILGVVKPLMCSHGSVQGRSAITNAKPHVGKTVVFSLDIQDFFPSISPPRVRAIFEALGFRGEAVNCLVKATTWDNQLPQGAPTSPSLANLSMIKVDVRLEGLAAKHGFEYTRYVDDLTFSGPERLMKFRNLIQRVVLEEGFTVNPAKVHTMHSGMRQVVTKLVVNTKLNLTRERRNEIRQSALQCAATDIEEVSALQGKLSWLCSVNPSLGLKIRQIAQIP